MSRLSRATTHLHFTRCLSPERKGALNGSIASMLADFLFAIAVTLPIFFVLCTGYILRRIDVINLAFADQGANLVFRVALPCLLFVKLVETDLAALSFDLVMVGSAATVGAFILLELWARQRVAIADRGTFVQASFRSNMGIIGLAFCLSAFGESALLQASIYMGLVTILYNFLSIITLTRQQADGDSLSLAATARQIATNPLIIAITCALCLAALQIRMPALALQTLSYLAQMTLPLALLCAGATIQLRSMARSKAVYHAVFAKLVLVPFGVTSAGYLVGLAPQALGILYLMSSAPTAAASYPMARALGGNGMLAAGAIALTAIGSILTTTMGLFLLRTAGWI